LPASGRQRHDLDGDLRTSGPHLNRPPLGLGRQRAACFLAIGEQGTERSNPCPAPRPAGERLILNFARDRNVTPA
jgi:hypothetical protein